jgi:ADP-ribosylglycohydrolase
MLPTINGLRNALLQNVSSKERQGHDCAGLAEAVKTAPTSYDALWQLAQQIAAAPLRSDWPWDEPNDLDAIRAACPAWPVAPLAVVDPLAIAPRVENAFLTSVCGCILGKPLEVSTDLATIRAAAEKVGEWPVRDYIPEALLVALGMRHGDAAYTTRETIVNAGADDDLNYAIIGMLLLERHGADFNTEDLARIWFTHLPCGWQWGPERTMNQKYAQSTVCSTKDPFAWRAAGDVANPGDEQCGALIRADAYGYACPGDPGRAAALAWKDAIYTHRRTGLYGTMFAAAAIAAAFTSRDWRGIFEPALACVPQRSRFADTVRRSLELVADASDWLDGYARVHNAFREHGHCQVYQEIGTVINTLRFAADPGEGICIQVSQGNDTDSFGCTAGAILGAFHGPGSLPARWLAPFHDTIHTAIAGFSEQRLSAVAQRMGRLPIHLKRFSFQGVAVPD